MTEDEVCTLYRTAKDKEKEIKIISECNVCSEDEVIQILRQRGYIMDTNELTEELTDNILNDYSNGMSLAKLSKKYNISIYRIKKFVIGNLSVKTLPSRYVKQHKQYYCELCGTSYDTKEQQTKCQNSHINILRLSSTQFYTEQSTPYPSSIEFIDDKTGTVIKYTLENFNSK